MVLCLPEWRRGIETATGIDCWEKFGLTTDEVTEERECTHYTASDLNTRSWGTTWSTHNEKEKN